jgi:hypothetical protein
VDPTAGHIWTRLEASASSKEVSVICTQWIWILRRRAASERTSIASPRTDPSG